MLTKDIHRPLSPHLQIYKPQITSILSISHRLAGIVLALVTISLVLVMFLFTISNSFYATFINFLHTLGGKAILHLIIFCFVYYLVNGIRYFCWDCGLGFSKNSVKKSSILVLILSFIGCLLIYFKINTG